MNSSSFIRFRNRHPLPKILVIALLFVAFPRPAVLSQSKDSLVESVGIIEDNSFFIEEAYNQEEHVVQHIFSATRYTGPSNNLMFSFTQEWPAWGQEHQLSLTIPYSMDSPGTSTGIGDVMINYRYQYASKDDYAACSPRLSLILPTGDVDKGLGTGTAGLQLNIPFSRRVSKTFVMHLNLGTTFLPGAQASTPTGRVKHALTWANTGASIVWLVSPTLNIMLETVQNFGSSIEIDGTVSHSAEIILSPALRYAINIGALQVVPGFAIPVSFARGDRRTGALLYISFEHPY